MSVVAVSPAWDDVASALDAIGLPGARPLRSIDDGAYSSAARWVVELGDGGTAFVKASRGQGAGVAREIATYRAQLGTFVPRLLGAVEEPEVGGLTVLVAEDLGSARWGVPLAVDDVRALRTALSELAVATPPAWVKPISPMRVIGERSWPILAQERRGLLDLGAFSEAWLDAALPALVQAAATFDARGTQLVHGDLWRQNWCIADRGAVIVDWTGTALGSALVNVAWAECAVRAAGGPTGIVLAPEHPEHAASAAWMAGVTCRFLLDDYPSRTERPRLWETQLREAFAALRWAVEALGLSDIDPAPGVEPSRAWRP